MNNPWSRFPLANHEDGMGQMGHGYFAWPMWHAGNSFVCFPLNYCCLNNMTKCWMFPSARNMLPSACYSLCICSYHTCVLVPTQNVLKCKYQWNERVRRRLEVPGLLMEQLFQSWAFGRVPCIWFCTNIILWRAMLCYMWHL